MKKILIVEDNKTLAKLISKKIELELYMECDIAYSLHEAKLFLGRFEYLLCVLDVNLPDAPNGEVIDFAIAKNARVIVLTGIVDKNFRKNMLKKEIIDYINKSSLESINQLISTIKRLQKNKKHKVLLVEDNIMQRNRVEKILKNMFFEVSAVAHGEEALGMLEDSKKPYSLVLTDYNMPVMDGFELTNRIREQYSKNELAIIAGSSSDDEEVIAMFLKNGANDFIKKPCTKEEFMCRINNTIESLENIYTLTNHLQRDFLTGLYSKAYFLKLASLHFNQESSTPLQMAIFSLSNATSLKSKYSSFILDDITVAIADIIRTSSASIDLVARCSDDEFCVLLVEASGDSVEVFCQKVLKQIGELRFIDTHNELVHIDVAYAKLHSVGDSLDESLSELDMLLYKNKR